MASWLEGGGTFELLRPSFKKDSGFRIIDVSKRTGSLCVAQSFQILIQLYRVKPVCNSGGAGICHHDQSPDSSQREACSSSTRSMERPVA